MNFEKPEKWEFWKNGKTKLLEISLFYMCTKSHNHMKYSSWDRVRQNFFFHFVPFFALLPPTPLTTQKTKILKKMKKASGRCHHFKLVQQKNTIIWCMLTLIWCETDTIFCHFRPFFALLPNNWHQKWRFGKNTKNNLSFYTCGPQMMIWCMVPEISITTNRIFCHFGLFFALLPTLTTQKIKILKKWKTLGRYYHFKHEYHKWKSYHVWLLRYGAQQIEFFSHFGPFFALLHRLLPPLLPPYNPETQRIQILKKWKKHLEISSFYTSVP